MKYKSFDELKTQEEYDDYINALKKDIKKLKRKTRLNNSILDWVLHISIFLFMASLVVAVVYLIIQFE